MKDWCSHHLCTLAAGCVVLTLVFGMLAIVFPGKTVVAIVYAFLLVGVSTLTEWGASR